MAHTTGGIMERTVIALGIAVVFAVAWVAPTATAQTPPDACEYAAATYDATCNDPPPDCPSSGTPTGCSRLEFTPTCTGDYTVQASVTGCTGTCYLCTSCVSI